ncbi:CHAT domain-containing protein [Streptomyces sp. NPDC005329]|uniref:CHAT domain-containing protein n=1 Tax=Streptomyces sp. NPDC005329 TaxID=3157034 RepID=UPI0033B7BF77
MGTRPALRVRRHARRDDDVRLIDLGRTDSIDANIALLRRGHLPDPTEDGLLAAADLATMDLSGTELVVLSARDTGRDQVAVGQGVYGLRRSVATVGARTLGSPCATREADATPGN